MESLIIRIFSFLFGSLLGSFANVIIYRMPRNESIIWPRSSCPNCKSLIKWYQNIPILSYLFLKGKCSNCGWRISIRYPLVEILMGVISVLLLPKIINSDTIVNYFLYLSVFVVFTCLFLIDLEHYILPNPLNIYLGAIFTAYGIIYLPWKYCLWGFFIGAMIPSLVSYLFYLIRKKVGLGIGDIKLYGVLGIYLGPVGIVQNIFFSCLLGSIVGGLILLIRKMDFNRPLPFGPFIITVAVFQIYFPGEWYKIIKYFFSF